MAPTARTIIRAAVAGAASLAVLASSTPAGAAGAFDTAFGGLAGFRTGLLGAAETGNRADCNLATPDGGLLIGGAALHPSTGAQTLALLKVGRDGLPDISFGDAGKALLAVGEDTIRTTSGYGCSLARDAAGGYVVSGAAADAAERFAFAVIRLTAQGAPDTTFGGGDGAVVDQLGTGPAAESLTNDVTVLPSGDIVAAGFATAGADTLDGVLARYDGATGQRAAGFGTAGVARLQFSTGKDVEAYTRLTRAAPLPNGDLLVAGAARQVSSQHPVSGVVARVRADGTGLVGTWGDAGRKGFAAPAVVQEVFARDDGSVVLTGQHEVGGFAARLTPEGQLDPTYGTGGVTDLDQESYAYGFAPRPDGGLLYARFSTSGDRVGIGALTAAGQPDLTWADDAVLDLTDDPGSGRQVLAMTPDGQGGAFFAGSHHTENPKADRFLYGRVVAVEPPSPSAATPPPDTTTVPSTTLPLLIPPLPGTPRLKTAKVTLDRLGRIALMLACPISSSCRGTIALKRGTKRLARRSYALRPGTTTKVRLALAKAERRGIAAAGRKGRRLSVVLTPASGQARTASITIQARR